MAGDGKAPQAQMIEVCWLFTATSARGTDYLRGRWGGVKVMILPKRTGDPGEHTHALFIAPAPARDGGR
jgi:hypothetical protein